MHQYVYWYSTDELKKNLQSNEIITDYYFNKLERTVLTNITTLEEWSILKYSEVLFDSVIDGKDLKTFRSRVENHKHLYFIVFDSNNNIFGHYQGFNINIVSECDPEELVFVFTLQVNKKNEAIKYNNKSKIAFPKYFVTEIYDDAFYFFGKNYLLGANTVITIFGINTKGGHLGTEIADFKTEEGETFTSIKGAFTPTRIIVIEMK